LLKKGNKATRQQGNKAKRQKGKEVAAAQIHLLV